MHWIMDWCYKHCGEVRKGPNCDKCVAYYCKPRFDLAAKVGCSEYLLWRLANGNREVTHPNIADRIADVTGATSRQRDSIVAAKHRGTYKRNSIDEWKKPDSKPLKAIPVVAIDVAGCEVSRFPSVVETARRFSISTHAVTNRCSRAQIPKGEFNLVGFTFRLASEWDAMTPEQRKEDMINARKS